MAKELIVRAWCDVCQDEDKQTEGDEYGLGLDGKDLTIDLCDEHAAPVIATIDLLRLHGQVPDAPAQRPTGRGAAQAGKVRGPYRKRGELHEDGRKTRRPLDQTNPAERLYCLFCDAEYVADSALAVHYRSNHDIDTREHRGLGGMHGARCPACGLQLGGSRALGRHIRDQHGWRHIAHGVGQVKDDPYGVLAAMRESLKSGTLV